jgi:small-conductance mechanosensitive channel
VNFHIGDKVRVGTRVGTITDVGTMLIQVETIEGGLRVVCPWELVRTHDR